VTDHEVDRGRAAAHKRVLVLGAYGTANLGDEAILESLLNTLARSPEPTRVTVLSTDERATTEQYGVPAVFGGWRRHLLRKIRLFRESDLLICGGGGLLHDTFPNRLVRGAAPRYSFLMLLARLLGCRVAVYAQGIGPLRTRYGRWISSLALRSAHLVTVRDAGSAEVVRDITRSRVRAHVGADPAVLLDPIPKDDVAPLVELAGFIGRGEKDDSRPLVAVCPRPWFHRRDIWPDGEPLSANYVENLRQIVSGLCRDVDCRVFLVPFDYHEDLPLCRDIEQRAGRTRNLRVVDTPLRPREMMGLLSAVDLLVGTRLHSLIFAARVGVAPLAIVYDPKVARFMEQIGRTEASFPIESLDPAAVLDGARRTLLEFPTAARRSDEARDRLVARARSAEELLLQLL